MGYQRSYRKVNRGQALVLGDIIFQSMYTKEKRIVFAPKALKKTSERELEFRPLILKATGDPLIIQRKAAFPLFCGPIEAGIKEHPETPVKHHTLIFEALKSKDPRELEAALLESYRYWQEHLKPAQKKEGKGEAPKK